MQQVLFFYKLLTFKPSFCLFVSNQYLHDNPKAIQLA